MTDEEKDGIKNDIETISREFLGHKESLKVSSTQRKYASNRESFNRVIKDSFSGRFVVPTLRYLKNNDLLMTLDLTDKINEEMTFVDDILRIKKQLIDTTAFRHPGDKCNVFIYMDGQTHGELIKLSSYPSILSPAPYGFKMLGIYYKADLEVTEKRQIMICVLPQSILDNQHYIPTFIKHITENQFRYL